MIKGLRFELKKWEDVSRDEIVAALQLRTAIFVVEQDCVYQDIDGLDDKAWHYFVWDGSVLASYCRIFPAGPSYPDAASIGRIITNEKYRGHKIAAALIRRSIDFIRVQTDATQIKMSAQAHLQKYYSQFEFKPYGEGYLEDGIPHIGMVRKIK